MKVEMTDPGKSAKKEPNKDSPPEVPAVAHWVNDQACFCRGTSLIPSLAHWVKDPALTLLWHSLQMQLRFNPWPQNFHMPWVRPKMNVHACVHVCVCVCVCVYVYMYIYVRLYHLFALPKDSSSVPEHSTKQNMFVCTQMANCLNT